MILSTVYRLPSTVYRLLSTIKANKTIKKIAMVNTIKRLTLFVLVSLTSLPVGVQAIDSPTAATRNNGSNRGSSSFSSFANNVGDVVKDFGDDVEGMCKVFLSLLLVSHFFSCCHYCDHSFLYYLGTRTELLENYSTFAGKIFPILSKFYIPPSKARQIFHEIKKEADLYEWITILVLGFATVPLIKYPYEKVLLTKRTKIGTTDERVKFEDTFVYQLTHHIAGAGKIAVLVYGLDCLIVAIKTMGFTIETKYSQLAAKGIYTTWIFSRLLQWKRYFVTRAVFAMRKGKKEGKENRAKIANQITDVLVFAICGFFLIDLLKVHAGVFLKSFFTLGAAGTGLISFASKDLAMGLISGLALQASDKIFEGDTYVKVLST